MYTLFTNLDELQIMNTQSVAMCIVVHRLIHKLTIRKKKKMAYKIKNVYPLKIIQKNIYI